MMYFYPHFEPPEHRSEWDKCICPVHEESRASAVINREANAFHCHACNYSGDVIGIVMREENIGFQSAIVRTEAISGRSYEKIQAKSPGKSGGRVFGKQKPSYHRKPGKSFSFPDWIR